MRRKHVVLTLGRSGSNTLVDMLNQNPAVLNVGEVLGEWMPLRKMQRLSRLYRKDDVAYLDAILGQTWLLRVMNTHRNLAKLRAGKSFETKCLSGVSSIGIKEFSVNFERFMLEDYLIQRDDVKVIGLVRPNVIDRMVSVLMLERTGVVSVRSSKKPSGNVKLQIDPEEALQRLDIVADETERLEATMNRIEPARLHRISYDSCHGDADSFVTNVRECYRFLGVPDVVPDIRMSKIIRKDPLDLIECGARLRDRIARTRHAKWLRT